MPLENGLAFGISSGPIHELLLGNVRQLCKSRYSAAWLRYTAPVLSLSNMGKRLRRLALDSGSEGRPFCAGDNEELFFQRHQRPVSLLGKIVIWMKSRR